MKFELTYFEAAVQYLGYYAKGTPHPLRIALKRIFTPGENMNLAVFLYVLHRSDFLDFYNFWSFVTFKKKLILFRTLSLISHYVIVWLFFLFLFVFCCFFVFLFVFLIVPHLVNALYFDCLTTVTWHLLSSVRHISSITIFLSFFFLGSFDSPKLWMETSTGSVSCHCTNHFYLKRWLGIFYNFVNVPFPIS